MIEFLNLKEEEMSDTLTFNKYAIRTASGPAYYRHLAKIPYATELYFLSECDYPGKAPDLRATQESTVLWESQYRLTNKLIKEMGIQQVLELGCGLSPRGLELTEDQSNIVVEVDLPGMIKTKTVVYHDISVDRPNLYSVKANVNKWRTRNKDVSVFSKEPIAIVAEGLFPYMNKAQIRETLRWARALLVKHGGILITAGLLHNFGYHALMSQWRNHGVLLLEKERGKFSEECDAIFERLEPFESDEEFSDLVCSEGFSESIIYYDSMIEELLASKLYDIPPRTVVEGTQYFNSSLLVPRSME